MYAALASPSLLSVRTSISLCPTPFRPLLLFLSLPFRQHSLTSQKNNTTMSDLEASPLEVARKKRKLDFLQSLSRFVVTFIRIH